MPLTLRLNGSSAPNLVTSSWFNDFYNLFTGGMTDQIITFKTNQYNRAISAAPGAPTLAIAAGGLVDVGAHTYAITFVAADGGETVAGTTAAITTTAGNQAVQLTAIPTGSTGTVSRNVYRSKVGTTSPLYLVTTLADNTTTTYNDSVADSTLPTTTSPAHPSFGGSLGIKDSGGAVMSLLYSDGAAGVSGPLYLNQSSVNGEAAQSSYIGVIANGTNIVDTYLANNAAGNIVLYCSNNGKGTWFKDATGFYGSITRGSTNALTISNRSTGPIGFYINGTKTAEIRANGNFVISGTTYQTTSSSWLSASSQSFDAFDVSEVYQCDATYPVGTVVTLGSGGVLTKNTTDGSGIAMVIVDTPAFGIGQSDPANHIHYCALVGTVAVNTAAAITSGQLVCADNNGGCRPLAAGEWQQILGIAIADSVNGQVGVFLRPTYAKG
jgi:hypothetical protein